MRSALYVLATFFVAILFTSTSFADGFGLFQRNNVCTSQNCVQPVRVVHPQRVVRRVVHPQRIVHQPVVQQQQVVRKQVQTKVQNQTTVVNNLVGIPVPVTYSEPIAAQGTTIYGYSSLADSYNQVDLGLLYNQAARLTDQAQQLAGQAHMDFSALVQAEGQNRAEVAKILAQGQAAQAALTATKGEPSQPIVRQFSFRVTQGENGQLEVEKIEEEPQSFDLATPDDVAQNVSQLLRNQCVSCHNSDNAQGGLNLLEAITDDQQRKILNRVTTDDLSLRMPRNPDGTAGSRLSSEELGLLFRAMSPQ